jgi:hypothetical protein
MFAFSFYSLYNGQVISIENELNTVIMEMFKGFLLIWDQGHL